LLQKVPTNTRLSFTANNVAQVHYIAYADATFAYASSNANVVGGVAAVDDTFSSGLNANTFIIVLQPKSATAPIEVSNLSIEACVDSSKRWFY